MDRDAVRREAGRLVGSARTMLREKGARHLARESVDFAASYALYPFSRRRFEGRTFTYNGRQLPYFRHHYNRAWRNERSVELAIARDFLDRHPGKRVLEIGNVLVHYGPAHHDVVDKYENAPNVMRVDIVDFAPDEPYDVIVSVSTLEHVGWDERPRQPDKVLHAYERLKQALAPGGAMLITAPLGQNPHLDRYIAEGRFDFPVLRFLKRVSRANDWVEVPQAEAAGARWGSPFPGTNAIFVGEWPGEGAPAAPPPT